MLRSRRNGPLPPRVLSGGGQSDYPDRTRVSSVPDIHTRYITGYRIPVRYNLARYFCIPDAIPGQSNPGQNIL